MKGSSFMVFEYVGMLAVPVILLALTATAVIPVSAAARTVLLLLLGAVCLVYGAVAIRAIYIHGGIHGGTKRETTAR